MTAVRLPPQNLEAERCVLASQILDDRKIDDVREIISPGDFYFDTHATIQRAMIRLRDGGSGVDTVTLAEELTRERKLADVGGVPYLLELVECVPHSEHAKFYANSVAKKARRRHAISIAQRLQEAAYDPSNDEDELSQSAIDAATKLAEQRATATKLWTMQDAVGDLITEFEKGSPPTVNVLIPEVDELIRGTAAGEMVIVGGRPSHGKSMFAIQCLDCASAYGWPGLMVSEEMLKLALAGRMMQRITSLETDYWINGTDRLRGDANAYFRDRAKIVVAEKCDSVGNAERAIAKAVREFGVRVVAVDYAQLLDGEGSNEQERISDVSRRMKAMAVKYDLRLILLAQMNRAIELRDGHEPELADLRGSGSLEQDGDVILFTTWPYQFDKTYENPLEYRIYQRKNRNRGISRPMLEMRFNPQRQILTAAPPDEYQQDEMFP